MDGTNFLVLIGGVNRSGTSLMRQLIGSHSQIAMPPAEFEFFKKVKYPHEQIRDRQVFSKLVNDILNWPKIKKWGLVEEDVLRAAQKAELSHQGLFLLFLDQYRQVVGKTIIGEKSTLYEQHLSTLDVWFERDYRFIHVIRHPINVFASRNWYKGVRQNVNVKAWAVEWVNSVRIGLNRSFTQPDSYRLIRYEDLILKPATVLESLCNFLGVDFEEKGMLSMKDFEWKDNSSFKSMMRKTDNQGSIRKTDDLDRAKMLSEQEISILTKLCGPTAELVGYNMYDADLKVIPQWSTVLVDKPVKDIVGLTVDYNIKRIWKKIKH